MRFLIMGSVFFTDRFIHENYDLKGSTHGRAATEKEKRQDVPVLKDLDFLEKHVKIRIAKDKAEALIEQVHKDSDFLQKLNIMDYSLLLGIHYTDRETSLDECKGDETSPATLSPVVSGDDLEKSFGTDALMPQVSRRQSHYGLRGAQEIIAVRNEFANALPLVSEEANKKKGCSKNNSGSIFCATDGGIRGVTADGTPSNVMYYMGIIDILQRYNAKKKLETQVKSISTDPESISSVKPSKYAKRFSKFIADAVDLQTVPIHEHESDDDELHHDQDD